MFTSVWFVPNLITGNEKPVLISDSAINHLTDEEKDPDDLITMQRLVELVLTAMVLKLLINTTRSSLMEAAPDHGGHFSLL